MVRAAWSLLVMLVVLAGGPAQAGVTIQDDGDALIRVPWLCTTARDRDNLTLARVRQRLLDRAPERALDMLYGKVVKAGYDRPRGIEAAALGILRPVGDPRFANGEGDGELCVQARFRVAKADLERLEPETLRVEGFCFTDPDRPIGRVKAAAKQRAMRTVAARVNPALAGAPQGLLDSLVRDVRVSDARLDMARLAYCADYAVTVVRPELKSAGAAAGAPERRETPGGAEAAPNTAFRDCARCPEMVAVPPGRVRPGAMTDPAADPGSVRAVAVGDGFALSREEITRAQYKACIADGGCPAGALAGDGDSQALRVDWLEARAYAHWLTDTTGHTYRLPSRAEWKHAARAGLTKHYRIGDGGDGANGDTAAAMNDGKGAGAFVANPFDLYDRHGSVWEWLHACGAEAAAEAACSRRMAWSFDPVILRSTQNPRLMPGARPNTDSFRVVRALDDGS